MDRLKAGVAARYEAATSSDAHSLLKPESSKKVDGLKSKIDRCFDYLSIRLHARTEMGTRCGRAIPGNAPCPGEDG